MPDAVIDLCADRKKCSSECKMKLNVKLFITRLLGDKKIARAQSQMTR